MKKRIMNIRPQEVTQNGERSVQYKGSDGKFHDLAAPAGGSDSGSTAQSGNIVMEIMFGNENRIFTAEELVTLVSQVLAGKNIVCISNNNWGTNNERRIALVTRINGFEVADGVVTISDTLNLKLSNCQDFDLDTAYFIKQVDGSYKMQYEFSK